MNATLPATVSFTAAALAVHLWADARGHRLPRALGKALASAAFLLLAALRATPDRYGLLVLLGLALSAAGDLCLLGRAKPVFLAGVGLFLAAHVAYAVAFAPRSRPPPLAIVALSAAGVLVVRWLWPHLGALRVPVLAYAIAITAMLVLALGVPDRRVQLGAALFYLSDLAVARDRFVAPGFANHLVGLPPYYAAQLLLAWTAGAG
ncbi:MAG TPA: lysoplasmalogenase [Anaeromyxobacter sp.]|nr:lysoplasmalogenase [Anaeromyxobacter sp.]